MSSQTRTPEEIDVFALWHEKAKRDVRVSLPCQVTAYDAGAQTVSVKPQVMEAYSDDNGVEQDEALPIIVGVPVEWPSGGGMRITFPLAAGDTGRIVFCDRSIDDWLGLGKPADTAPADGRRHALQDAVFTPGLKVKGQNWSGVSTSAVQIGQDGASMSAVALASKVDALNESLSMLLSAIMTWVAAVSTFAGTASTTPPTTPAMTLATATTALATTAYNAFTAGPPKFPSSTASETVEILG